MLTSEMDRQETKLIEALTLEMRDKELRESTIKAIVTTDLLPTNKHLEKMLKSLGEWQKPTDELVLAKALIISDEE